MQDKEFIAIMASLDNELCNLSLKDQRKLLFMLSTLLSRREEESFNEIQSKSTGRKESAE